MSSVRNLLNNISSTPSVKVTGRNKFELHSLTSHKHLYYYLWSIKSFLWSSDLDPRIVIHDDGTLTSKDIKTLNIHLNGAKIITNKQADTKVLPQLRNYPSCYKYRTEQPFAKKVFDILMLAEAKKIIVLDSDVLFFKKPTEITNWVTDNNKKALYNWDPFDLEINLHRQFKKNLGIEYAAGYNSGLQCLHKNILNIDFLEHYLSYCYKQEKLDWWVMEQRSMALLTHKYYSDKCTPLPREKYFFQNRRNAYYKNRNTNTFPSNLIVKHYSRYARTYFATEGVKKLLRDIKWIN